MCAAKRAFDRKRGHRKFCCRIGIRKENRRSCCTQINSQRYCKHHSNSTGARLRMGIRLLKDNQHQSNNQHQPNYQHQPIFQYQYSIKYTA